MMQPSIKLAGEGYVDLAVLTRLAIDAGFSPAESYGRSGKSFIDARILNWNEAARHSAWFVLRDLDNDADCAAELIDELLPDRALYMCFRIAVKEVESWLLADIDACEASLGLRRGDLVVDTVEVVNAKALLLRAGARARKRVIRDSLVARTRSGLLVEGDSYNAVLSEFARSAWRPHIASRQNRSLRRAIERLAELKEKLTHS